MGMSIRPRLPKVTFARVVAGTAILLLLTTGTAYAANQITGANIKNGTVTTKDIKNNNLKSKDIKDGQLQSVDVKDESLTSADILDGTITSDDLADNSIDSGEIVNGAVRASDLGTITQRSATSAVIPPGGNGSVTASCLAGEVVLSGGNDGFFDLYVVAARKSGNGWAVFARNDGAANRTITAHAYCLAQ